VPADPSSPIPAALTHSPAPTRSNLRTPTPRTCSPTSPLSPTRELPVAAATPLVAILGLAAAAVLAGARSIAAIAEWTADAPPPVRAALGARRDAPDHFAVPAEATIRRTLSRLDGDVLAAAVGAWLAERDRRRPRPAASRRRAVAVDGKTLRGARGAGTDGRRAHLLACMDHATRAVLAQRQVGGAPEEVPAFAPLLGDLDLARAVVTADALQTHPEAAEFLVREKRAHYLLCVKANQPTLLARCAALPWLRVPVLDRTRDRGHGRIEVRTLKAVSVHHVGFPHAAQVLQVTRKTRALHAPRRFKTVIVYAVTSLPFEQAGPARLADLLRGHWAIEALHHIRDVTLAEDASQARTGSGPHVMATLRNLVIGVLCPGRAGQRRRRAAPPRPRPTPTPGHPRHHAREQLRMNRPSRHNDGVLPPSRSPARLPA
jgi:predicted transposase YbfD/YdcC